MYVLIGDELIRGTGTLFKKGLGSMGSSTLASKFEDHSQLTAFALYGIIGTYMLWKASHMAGALTGSLAVAFSMGHHGGPSDSHGGKKGGDATAAAAAAEGVKTKTKKNTADGQDKVK